MKDNNPQSLLLWSHAPNRRQTLLAILGPIAGCSATAPSANNTEKSTLELLSWSSSSGQALVADSVLMAMLKFSISNFENESFEIFEQFASIDPGITKTVTKTNVTVRNPTGEATVSFRIGAAIDDPKVAKPVRVKFVLTRRTSDGGKRIVAETPFFQLNYQK